MPTEKRARQKEGRRVRLEAERKVQRRRSLLRRTGIVIVVAGVVTGSVFLLIPHNSTPTTTTTSTTTTTFPTALKHAQDRANAVAVSAGCPESPAHPVNALVWNKAPAMTIDKSATYTAVFKTTLGNFDVRLYASKTPITVNNFVFLADQGYYKCNAFFRVVRGFVNQTGSASQQNTGTVGYTIPDEYPPAAKNAQHQYPLGSLAMANTGQPHTGGGQFFIVAGPQGEALPPSYSLFGQVTSGLAVVKAINSFGSEPSDEAGIPEVTERVLTITITKS